MENKDQNTVPQNQEMSISDKFKMYSTLLSSSHLMIENFILLFLKKNDARLDDNIRKQRDNAEKVIFFTSLAGKALAFFLITSQISFLNRIPFNPIRDTKTLLASFASIYFCDSVPIVYYWPTFEDYIMKFNPEGERARDLYADNLMSSPKVYYYNNWI